MNATPRPLIQRYAHGIAAVDGQYMRPGMVAIHLVVEHGRAAIIDTGSSHSVAPVIAALAELGLAPAAVELIILTHIHLDHAGGAGALMALCPKATLIVHPRGASHMADPDKLVAGTRAVYGPQRFAELYGTLRPISAARIQAVEDGATLRLGERQFEILHTPGHALHHLAILDARSSSLFTGDTFGLSYRATDSARGALILPSSTPTQFDPQQLLNSIERVASLRPQALFLTHYSRVTGIDALAAQLRVRIAELIAIAERHAAAEDAEQRIVAAMALAWRNAALAHGCTLPAEQIDALLAIDVELNAQGLLAWMQRRASRPGVR